MGSRSGVDIGFRAVNVLPVVCTANTYKRTLDLVTKFFETIYLINQIVIFVQKHFHIDIVINYFFCVFHSLSSCLTLVFLQMNALQQMLTNASF